MKSYHVTWICVIGTSTVAGILVGRLATEEPPPKVVVEAGDEELFAEPWPSSPRPFPESAFDPTDVRMAELEQDGAPAKSNPPGVLPESVDAAPIDLAPPESEPAPGDPSPTVPDPTIATDRDPSEESLVRDMITEQLPNASPRERDIWYEELKGLPTDKLVEVLRIRKYLGSIVPLPELPEIVDPLPPVDDPTAIEKSIDAAPPVVDVEPPSLAQPSLVPRRVGTPTPRYDSRALENSLFAIARAEQVHLQNIANANTYGFRRRRPVLVDLPVPKSAGAGDQRSAASGLGNGCHLVCSQLDDRQGSLVTTGRSLDVAIAGRGFLQFTKGDHVVYGRCGALTLNGDGQVVSFTGLPLEPSITVPSDTTGIVVATTGRVTANTPNAMPMEVGQLQLATFVNPAGLDPIGDTMFEATTDSGTPNVVTPGTDGAGTVRSACLESANVDLDLERRELNRLRRQASVIRELLGEPPRSVETPHLARPAEPALRRTSATRNTTSRDSATRNAAVRPSPGPFLVLRPDMLPK